MNWNSPGAAVPTAPPPYVDPDPRCGAQERTSESPEEDLVVGAGWRLFNAARVGWGLLDSRTDGSGRILDVRGRGLLTGQLVRDAATDPLCCPSSVFVVEYRVNRGGRAPVLVPRSATRTTALLGLDE